MERLIVNSLFKENDEVIKEMKEKYLACSAAVKYVKSLNIPDEAVDSEIVKINDLVCDINFCRHCPGVDKCNKATPRLVTRIVYEEGVVDRQIVPCKEYLKYVNFKRQFVIRDFPEEWLTSSLKKIDNSVPRAEVIKKYESYKQNGQSTWIYLTGEEGTGRSFVAANIAIDLAREEKGPIAFIDVPSKFKELQNKKDNSFNESLEQFMTIPVLVMDEIGNEYVTDFVRDAILYPILNARSKNHLLTIFTSDFNIDSFATLYEKNVASKPKIEQIKKLLKKNCGQEINLGSLSIYK